MEIVSIIGFLAGVFTTFAHLPQVIKTFKLKNAKDVSFRTYIMLFIGIGLWAVYGFMLNDLPLILANVVALVLITTELFLIWTHRKD